MFCKKSALKNFAKITGKHQCLCTFYNKIEDFDLRPVNFAKFLRTPFFLQNNSGGCFNAFKGKSKVAKKELS